MWVQCPFQPRVGGTTVGSGNFQRNVKARCLPGIRPLPQRKEMLPLPSLRYIKDGGLKLKGHQKSMLFLDLSSNVSVRGQEERSRQGDAGGSVLGNTAPLGSRPTLISKSSLHEARIHIFWGLQRVGNHIRTLAST